MELTVWMVLLILSLHFIADFVLQTEWMAKNKWQDNDALLTHIIVYFIVFLLFGTIGVASTGNIWFIFYPMIIAIMHYCTDKYSSRITHKLWEQQKTHLFFVVIGADQLFHYIQLLLIYKLLIG